MSSKFRLCSFCGKPWKAMKHVFALHNDGWSLTQLLVCEDCEKFAKKFCNGQLRAVDFSLILRN